MSTSELLIVCFTVLALGGLAVLALVARATVPGGAGGALALPLESRVAVHLLSGSSLRGRVVECGSALRLVEAEAIAGGGASQLAGVVVVPVEHIDWTQEL